MTKKYNEPDPDETISAPHNAADAETPPSDDNEPAVSETLPAEDDAAETSETPSAEDGATTNAADSDAAQSSAADADELARAVVSTGHGGKFSPLKQWCKRHKVWSMVIAFLAMVIVLAAIPVTRYAIAGTVLKQTITVAISDAQTEQPVSSAAVTIAGKTVLTNGQGRASVRVPVGSTQLSLSKKYYASFNEKYLVPIRKPQVLRLTLTATGRQVPIIVANKISGQPVENATVKALDTEAKTDKTGHATLVLPADKTSVPATVTASGYNTLNAAVQITAQAALANSFAITPAGSVYFLSNLSGKIDVVKTNLDGSSRQTVLAGTGKEDPRNTVLLASRDWKYLALLSNRDGTPKLYLITTATGVLATMDEGSDVSFTPVGWSNDTFVYTVQRSTVQNWQSGQSALKSFNAPAQKLTMLDQTTASGTNAYDYTGQSFSQEYILSDNEIVYTKNAQAGSYAANLQNLQATFNSISADGTNKKTIKAFGVPSTGVYYGVYVGLFPDKPDSVYVSTPFTSPTQYSEYEDGQLKAAPNTTDQSVNSSYATYLLSPSGSQTFWSESRDGKNALFVGDASGQNGKQIATLSDHQTYGWYSDNYLLVSKNASELYILPASGTGQPLKVSDYYKPAASFPGYGGGYGGL